LKCQKCDKVLNFEKIITPDGRAFHVHCWSKEIPSNDLLDNVEQGKGVFE